ncbi:ABA4-like family protein [Dongia rigui]|uniref:ABA4-like family protein n=1 Tax=Dongia rigui TaxID=940149 RepID=A0ABU5DWL0_9PROT|nr:ABA4-like family protein [Dongia rigui]MDY0871697.1 ABA4-like family protein [Dongia rigui]
MDWNIVFKGASSLALVAWGALVLLPRWRRLVDILRFGVPGVLALLYVTLIFGFFFGVDGGGFQSIAQVRALFASDPVLVAGWVHYLAFDLFVGIWIARRADAMGLNRFLQAPILIATFMFGPLGLALFYAVLAADRVGRRGAALA